MENESIPPEEPHLQILLFLLTMFNALGVAELLGILAILVLLAFSALVSGSEIAFFSLSPKQLEELKQQSASNRDKRVLELINKPRILLSTILISNNLINIAIIVISFFVINSTIDFSSLPPHLASVVVFLINTLVVTFLLVLFGEVSPKVYANQNNLSLARTTSAMLLLFRTILYPLAKALAKSSYYIEQRLLQKNVEINLEEIDKAIELSTDSDSTEQDVDLLKSIVHFGNITVKQIMVPRIDIVAIDNSMSYHQVIEIIKESGYSRIPVYQESIDNIQGILYIKDFLMHLEEDNFFEWQTLIRDAFFVPETKKIDDLLREIQENRKHQAIVVDEYGGTSGLITLEDILEEVVGDIKDEYDDDIPDADCQKIDAHNYVLEGKMLIQDACKVIGLDASELEKENSDADSVGGLVVEILGKIPKKGESVSYKRFDFLVLSIENNRIHKLKITIHDR